MKILRMASAGTLESSDALVMVSPGDGALVIEIESVVLPQFGGAIRAAVEAVAGEMGVAAGLVQVNDRGALDCTLRARVETALKRGTEAAQ
ncbi:MAG: citrate lyase acyl carrier protein [Clostridiales bacterium]|nr:citrate lyase acyl carrier protein [Clostridiales bacterium]